MINLTNFAPALKTIYPEGLEVVWYPDNPFFAVIPKETNFEGEAERIIFEHTGIGASNDFAVANAATYDPTPKKFTVDTLASLYAFGHIDNQTIARAKSNKGAIAKAVDRAFKRAMYGFSRTLAAQFWGNGGGALARTAAASAFSTTTCTLLTPDDAVNFEVGQELVAASTDGTSGSLRVGSATVTAIDRQAGTLTSDANWTTQITGATNSDYLFSQGNFGSVCIKGILAYIPVSAPTSGDSFWGCDRSTDVERLAGQRVNGGGAPLEETAFDSVAQAIVYGGHPDLLLVHPRRGAEMRKTMNSKSWQPIEMKATNPVVSFRSMAIAGPKSDITVLEDPQCPYARSLLTRRDSWCFKSADAFPHFEEGDGSKFAREAGADGLGFRLKGYGQLFNYSPKDTVLITW